MSSHYIDLRLHPDPETSPPQLLGALYDRLHLTLAANQRSDIGVSFPGYAISPRTLGVVMRLHGSETALTAFSQPDWLHGLRDHVRAGPITAVPSDVQHRTVHREQFKTNVERLRRRRMRRKGETAEQAAAAIPASVERRPHLPFALLRSRSTGQAYHLFIALGPLRSMPAEGNFSTYGLSPTATVPWF